MTQKELLYLEDAIGHEKNIISIVEDTKERLEDEELKEFLESELQEHNNTLESLMSKLEASANEWSNING